MPKKILTKRGKQFLGWIYTRVLKHTIGYIILILALIVGYKMVETRWLKNEIKTSLTLKEGEQRKAVIDFRQKTMTTIIRDADGEETQTMQNFAGLRTAVLTELSDGTVDVYAPTWGFVFEPGLNAFIADSRPHLGLDLQWFYWRRLGLSSGVGLGNKTSEVRDRTLSINGYPFALNYNLPFRWTPNTNIFMGATLNKEATGGMSVKF